MDNFSIGYKDYQGEIRFSDEGCRSVGDIFRREVNRCCELTEKVLNTKHVYKMKRGRRPKTTDTAE